MSVNGIPLHSPSVGEGCGRVEGGGGVGAGTEHPLSIQPPPLDRSDNYGVD